MAVREVARILPFIHVVWTSKVLSASFFVFAALFGGFFTTSNFLFSSLRSLSTCSRNAKGTEIKKKEKLCEIARLDMIP